MRPESARVLLVALACFALACSSSSAGVTAGADASEREDARPSSARHDASDARALAHDAALATLDASRGTPERDAADDAVARDAAMSDAHGSDAHEASDASGGCEYGGAPGTCIETSACDELSDHTAFAGYCPGPADIQCCIVTPNTANNPPTPAGYMLMQQSQVTSAMTAWAVMILDDPTMYPMFSTTTMTFGTLDVLARVEWHPPDFQNSAVHRGVTLYVPV